MSECNEQICIMNEIELADAKAEIERLEAELEEARGELESLIQFTRSEIRKLPAELVGWERGHTMTEYLRQKHREG